MHIAIYTYIHDVYTGMYTCTYIQHISNDNSQNGGKCWNSRGNPKNKETALREKKGD